jgi:hypothetical protein
VRRELFGQFGHALFAAAQGTVRAELELRAYEPAATRAKAARVEVEKVRRRLAVVG